MSSIKIIDAINLITSHVIRTNNRHYIYLKYCCALTEIKIRIYIYIVVLLLRTLTKVARTRLNVMLSMHCLSWYICPLVKLWLAELWHLISVHSQDDKRMNIYMTCVMIMTGWYRVTGKPILVQFSTTTSILSGLEMNPDFRFI